MNEYKNEMEQLIYQVCYDRIWNTVAEYVANHPASLEYGYSRVQYPDSASLEDMLLEFSTNITVDEDTLTFDAVVSCTIELEQETSHGDVETDEVSQWFKVTCSALIEDGLKRFNIHNIDVYSKGERSNASGVAASKNIVPIIHKDQLDAEASQFLEKYYPEALQTPMAVPIEEIVRYKMGLNLLQGIRLTDNFSLFGQICFSKGRVRVYDLFDDAYTEVNVDRGTIIIDASTYWERNLGCVNNTIAHEAFHWHRHRLYAAIKSLLRGEKFIACRCPTDTPENGANIVWTDERRMEWQADHIAPRILMPLEPFRMKVEELYERYGYHESTMLRTVILECVIDELSTFFKVSKQSTKIRMTDLGYKEAAGVYNYDAFTPYFSLIGQRDAFYEYSDNEDFRHVIDSGLFVYADGYFAINDEKYVTVNADGSYSLTEFASDNLAECTLQFTYRRVNMQEHGQFHADAFHRTNRNAYEKLPQYDTDKSIAVISNAEELRQKRLEFEAQYEQHKAMTKTFWQRAYEIMEAKHWNSRIFCDKTLLNEIVYSRAKNDYDSLPDIRTVMAICAGLDLDMPLTNELLALAGHTLSNGREHQALGFVITGYKGKDIYERNEFLESLDLPLLGSKQRQ